MDFGLFVPCHRVEKLRADEALGVSQFIVYAAFEPDHGRTMASLRRFAAEVMPRFTHAAAAGRSTTRGHRS